MGISKYLILGVLLLSLLAQMGCSPSRETTKTASNTEDRQKATDNLNAHASDQIRAGYMKKIHTAFSVEMPNEWKEIEYNGIMFYLPPGSEITNPVSEKIEVIAATGIPKGTTFDSLTEKGVEDTKKIVPDLMVDKKEKIQLDGFDAIKITLTGTIMGKRFENVQISSLNNNVLVSIIHNCFKDNCKDAEIYNEMIGSIELYTEFCGMEITGFADQSPARDAGMSVGEKILFADDEPIDNTDSVTHAMAQKRSGDSIALKTKDKEYDVKVISGPDGQGAVIGIKLGQMYCKKN